MLAAEKLWGKLGPEVSKNENGTEFTKNLSFFVYYLQRKKITNLLHLENRHIDMISTSQINSKEEEDKFSQRPNFIRQTENSAESWRLWTQQCCLVSTFPARSVRTPAYTMS